MSRGVIRERKIGGTGEESMVFAVLLVFSRLV